MASGKSYLDFILEQLSGLEEISYRAMMGEYMLYYKGKLAAYICDDRLLVKPVPAALSLLPGARFELPYTGAKQKMLLVEEWEDKEFLERLFREMYPELPEPKKKKTAKK